MDYRNLPITEDFRKVLSARQLNELEQRYNNFQLSKLYCDMPYKTNEFLWDTFMEYLKVNNKTLFKSISKSIDKIKKKQPKLKIWMEN